MINIIEAKRKCRDDISKIENYELAVNDKKQMWICHHRLELTLDGEFAHTPKELKRLGMYLKRPYFELIFLTNSEHRKLHSNTEVHRRKMSETHKGKKASEETKRKISEVQKGKPRSIFGLKFKEHFGITRCDNIKLYNKERDWCRNHNNKCRWE